jgi:hypothetical protein
MGSGTTKFKKTEVARIVEGVKMTGALGTFEFQLADGVVRFYMTGETTISPPVMTVKPSVWDKVLPDGKAKPALTICKKVP